ncbi:MAG: ribosome recycling factor [Blastocatellia bacterium]|nr:ribosome recycling factor [Chloracidobacterium sp.]MBL8185865.1 ribosome recycling factor [Blastocatellia bacterium]HRJ87086.1 ribosome recycling factor [Pyrinomonadaceae bacterium]HRK51508.1 ribosome recycling factor [Pyrinomonadaceae bacterium]
MSVDTVVKETSPKMDAVIEDFKRKLSNVRTGRATVGLLDTVHVDYYGTSTPLIQMASVAVPEPQLITVQPWDMSQLGAVEKAIIAANLGLNPSNDGKVIRLPVPPLNEERRKQLAKQVHEIAEDHRIAVRNVRHASNDALKKMLKEKEVSEDEEKRGLDEVQKLTNAFIAKIDELTKNKEHEIMSV